MAKKLTHVQEVITRAKKATEKKAGKPFEKVHAERTKRLMDAIELKVPDKVPVYLKVGYYTVKYGGLKESDVFYDPGVCQEALINLLVEYGPDTFTGNPHNVAGKAMDILQPVQLAWPGGNLRHDQMDQFYDLELMTGDEYDIFISDPDDYVLRFYLPRAFKALAPFAKLPPFQSLVRYSNLSNHAVQYTSPEMVKAFKAFYRAGLEQEKYNKENTKFGSIGEVVGMPSIAYGKPGGITDFGGSVGIPPFDLFANHLRGMQGVMIDMFKRPEKLLAACERFLEWQLARAVPADPKKNRVRGGSNHFMSEEFMSRKQFDKFVWPTWKKYLLAAIDMGYVPSPFMEGKNDDRIECFLELPKGKAIIGLEKIDIKRAKDILGDHLCFYGGVPASLLWGGSPQEVEEYCKDILRYCGKGGGFIISCATSVVDAKPANIKAMIDAVHKYGRF